MLMKPYKVRFGGSILEFRELFNANTFCEKNGLPYPKRTYEKEIQPHARGWFATNGDSHSNRDRQEKERLQPQL